MTETPYRPLSRENKEIRLLDIAAGNGHDEVRCTLQTGFLPERPVYETISYIWGDAGVRGTIHVNGKLVDVPASSEAAIRRVRLLDQVRIIWIDAVCINQEDVAERGQQVGIMDGIYEGSHLNLVCLEYCGVNAEDIVVTIEAVLQDAREQTNDLKDLGKAIWDARGQLLFGDTSQRMTADPKPLRGFFSNPWFGRKWVLQEAALAPSSVCLYEQQSIDLIDALRAAAWLRYKSNDPIVDYNEDVDRAASMFDMVDRQHGGIYTGFQKPSSLLAFLRTGMLAATEPRDHVFGVMGIYRHLSRSRQHHLQLPTALASPDYNNPLTEIFTAATRHVATVAESLKFLLYVEQYSGDGNHLDLPSWVLRWHKYNTRFCPLNRDGVSYTANDTAEWSGLEQTDEERILVTGGWIFTTVSNVTSIQTTVDELQCLNTQEEVYTTAENLIQSSTAHFRNTRRNLLGITLSAGVNPESKPSSVAEARYSHQLLAEFLQREGSVPHSPNHYAHLEQDNHDRMAAVYHNQVELFHRGRRLFIATGPAIGLGPSATRVGDLVVVLYGLELPAVLRPSPHLPDGIHYQFIGVCYVHELMDGTATREYKAAGGQSVTFKLV